jgi:phage terminase large subunit-like protein
MRLGRGGGSSVIVAPYIGDPIAWRKHKIQILKAKICFGGLDAGVVNDFSCLALYFPIQKDVPVPVILLWAWAPENVSYHTILKERYGYHDWVKGDFLKLTRGPVTDYGVIEEDILQLNRDYQIEELAFDQAYITQLVQRLRDRDVNMVEHRQGTLSMTGPIKEFQRQIMGRVFVHGMNPLLTFAVDNLVVESDGKGNLCTKKPGNPNSPRKIDPAQASIMALGRSAANPDAVGSDSGKVYFG